MNKIENFREKISELDTSIVELLIQRFHYSYMIGIEKKIQKLPIVSVHHFKIAMEKYRDGLGDYGEEIYHLIHDISKKIQENETDNL
jgi:chorismate mutase